MRDAPRILMYSHDTFGLGHLRRCQTIAQHLASSIPHLSVLILSGSPIIGSFDFKARVDFVRIPGVIKLRNGDYTSLNLHLDIEQTLQLRASIIEHTAKAFRPDIFIVDKEPLGLHGEVEETLKHLRQAGTKIVLGLRDVLDDADIMAEEWERKDAYRAIDDYFDEVWIYGMENIYDPLKGLPLTPRTHAKTLFTGYLRRKVPSARVFEPVGFEDEPYILVTPGGGGDGIELVDWVIKAYEAHTSPLFPALIVLGPFMPQEKQAEFFARADKLRLVRLLRFTPHIETLMQEAVAVVGMGGYNTFCEILSFDKPALLVPRVIPRREQAIRAIQAQKIGLVNYLPIDSYPDVEPMIRALTLLPRQSHPSSLAPTGMLDGLQTIERNVMAELAGGKETPHPEHA